MMSGEEAAHRWVQTFINQCTTGTHAELRLLCEGGHLKVTMCADLGRITAKTDCWGVPKGGPSRMRRRERRAAERAAVAATVKVDAEKDAAEKVGPKKAVAENAIPENVVASEEVVAKKETAEEVDAEQSAAKAEKATAEKVTAANAKKEASEKKAAEKEAAEKEAVEGVFNRVAELAETVASTSRLGSQQSSCWTCDGSLTPDHHCTPVTSPQSIAVGSILPPLPLCHYCCHRGSGEHPVHYYPQCLCMERKCDCQCYCTQEQLNHRKKLFPNFYRDVVHVDPKDWLKAKATAEARVDEQNGHRPCGSDNCVTPFS